MIRVLSIGNSFSQDAQRYLHRIGEADGEKIKSVNLYIPGCSLRHHYINILENLYAYTFEFNGESTGLRVSVRQALESDEWDYVTLQQVSRKALDFDTWVPYVGKLADYARVYAPKAKILIHQTWAYEEGSRALARTPFEDPHDMLAGVIDACDRAAELAGAAGIIRSGEAMTQAADAGLSKTHRDGFHASLGAGRYLLGRVWFRALTCRTPSRDLAAYDEEISREDLEIIHRIV